MNQWPKPLPVKHDRVLCLGLRDRGLAVTWENTWGYLEVVCACIDTYAYIYMLQRCVSQTPSLSQQYPPPHLPSTVCFKIARNSHRDGGFGGCHPGNCRCVWYLKAAILICRHFQAPAASIVPQKVRTVTRITVVLIAILAAVVSLKPHCCCVSQVPMLKGIRVVLIF